MQIENGEAKDIFRNCFLLFVDGFTCVERYMPSCPRVNRNG